MARILGLDLGAWSVKALTLESSFRGYTVRSFTEVKRTEDGGLVEALAELKAKHPFDADQAIVAVPGVDLATQLVTLPFTDPKKIDAVIALEFENLTPFELSDIAFGYQLLPSRAGKSFALAGSVPREVLSELLAELKALGLDPSVVTSNSVVYQNVFAQAPLEPESGPVVRAQKRQAPPPKPKKVKEKRPSRAERRAALQTPPPPSPSEAAAGPAPDQPGELPPESLLAPPSETPEAESEASARGVEAPTEPTPPVPASAPAESTAQAPVPAPASQGRAAFELEPTDVPTTPLEAVASVEPPPPPPPAAPAIEGLDAIVDLGHERTGVCVGSPKGPIWFARTFSGGGRNLTRAIADEFQVSLADAEVWKEREGTIRSGEPPTDESTRAVETLRHGFAPILRELRATLRSHLAQAHRPVTRLWITGGGAKLRGLAEYLSEELEVAVKPLRALPRESLAIIPEAVEPTASQAFALALRGHGVTRHERFNLRTGAFSFQGNLDFLRGNVTRIGSYAGILVLLAIISAAVQFQVLSNRETKLDKVLCDVTQKIFGNCQKDFNVALSMLKGKGSPAAALPAASALELFAELTNRSQAGNVTLDQVDVTLDKIGVRGTAENFEGVDQLVDSLKKYNCFSEIKRGKVQKSRDGSKVEFDLDIRVDCAAEGEI